MAGFPHGFWGPKPQWALLPVAAVAGGLFWLAWQQDQEEGGALAVTASRPLSPDGDTTPAEPAAGVGNGSLPMEVRYGVPTIGTAKQWGSR